MTCPNCGEEMDLYAGTETLGVYVWGCACGYEETR